MSIFGELTSAHRAPTSVRSAANPMLTQKRFPAAGWVDMATVTAGGVTLERVTVWPADLAPL